MLELAYPWVLALLPLPLVIWRLLPAYREQEAAVQAPMLDRLAAATGEEPREGAVLRQATGLQRFLAPVVWLLLVLAAAQPQRIEPPISRILSARDLLLAVDLSGSMETEDFQNEKGQAIARLDAVKAVLNGFIERREGDRIGLVAFGTAPYLQVPFTQDHDITLYLLDETRVGMAGPQTMIGDAIGFSITRFQESKASERVLILLTDGNDTGSRMPPRKAADIASQHDITIHCISVGDPEAVGETALDVEALRDIAGATGGSYFHADDRSALEAAYQKLDALEASTFETLSYRPRIPLFRWPLGIAVGLVFLYHIGLALLAYRSGRRLARA